MATAPAPLDLSDLEATPPTGTLLCHLSDLPDHGGKELVFTEGRFRTSIFVQKIGEDISVFLNYCPHAGTPLNMFNDRFLDLKGKRLLCRTHGATFDPVSGKCLQGPCKGQYLRAIAVSIRDGAVYSA